MTDNVIPLGNVTSLDQPPERILDEAKEYAAGGVVIMALDEHGNAHFGSSIADGGTVIWLAELLKRELLKAADELEQG